MIFPSGTAKKQMACLLLSLLMLCTGSAGLYARGGHKGWKLAVQSYTFHKFTLVETLDKVAQLGVRYIEVYPGHRLGGEWGDQVFGPGMDASTQRAVRSLAASKGIRIVGTGVFVSDNREDWEQLFRFAHGMKMEYVTCEPPLTMWDEVERLAEHYKVKVAVHNHPRPSDYWKPQLLLDAISERSQMVGACCDVGHWRREGLDHLQCLRQLKGRVVSLHFKDIEAPREGKEWQEDVIWGRGVLQMPAMLDELSAQGFKGYFAIEYETNWDNSVPDIAECISYFKQLVKEKAGSPRLKKR